MTLLSIVLTLIVIGFLLYLVNSYLPLEGMIKKLINILVISIVCVWLLKIFGLWSYLSRAHL